MAISGIDHNAGSPMAFLIVPSLSLRGQIRWLGPENSFGKVWGGRSLCLLVNEKDPSPHSSGHRVINAFLVLVLHPASVCFAKLNPCSPASTRQQPGGPASIYQQRIAQSSIFIPVSYRVAE